MSLFRHSFRPLSSFMAAITGESSSASLNSLFIILSLILSSFLFMLSQNNAHPSSSKSMMPYDDDTLLANAHYIMKCPASQDETPKRLRLHSVIFLHLPYKPVLYDPVFPLWMPHRLPQRGHRLHWLLYESGQ